MTLDLLLTEMSVSRTAVRLGISQAAVSAQLARLRSHFEDELFVTAGRRLVRTPFAASLAGSVSEFVQQAGRLSNTRQRFDPVSAERQFCVRAGDIETSLLLAPLVRRLSREAPGISLCVVGVEPVQDRLRKPDFSFRPLGIHDLTQSYAELYQDEYCVLCDAGHADVGDAIDVDFYLDAHHIVRQFGTTGAPSLETMLMQQQGHVRKVGVIVDYYGSIPYFLLGTRYLSTVPRRYAEEMTRHFPLRIVNLPVNIPLSTVVVQWPRHLDNDVGALWFRDLLREVASEVYPRSFPGVASANVWPCLPVSGSAKNHKANTDHSWRGLSSADCSTTPVSTAASPDPAVRA
ncbi:LysR substrate-binding domain-containing protein [Paraburkholderia tropica]|uniref:LysR substrate-binding domain-containing protein n=1 Tax=Paraburkholderia tropica TaxID=92647 RepID=UPI002AB07585|nr:LysR substrate-binding domain-containing protein [Paraburkholderia tropica]